MKSSAFKESFLLTIGEKYYQLIRLYNSQSTSVVTFIALTSFICFRKVMQDQGFRQDFQSHSRFINSSLGNLAIAKRNGGTGIKKAWDWEFPGSGLCLQYSLLASYMQLILSLFIFSALHPENWSTATESFPNQKRNVSQRLLFPKSMCRIKVAVLKFYFGLTLDNVIVSTGKLSWS